MTVYAIQSFQDEEEFGLIVGIDRLVLDLKDPRVENGKHLSKAIVEDFSLTVSTGTFFQVKQKGLKKYFQRSLEADRRRYLKTHMPNDREYSNTIENYVSSFDAAYILQGREALHLIRAKKDMCEDVPRTQRLLKLGWENRPQTSYLWANLFGDNHFHDLDMQTSTKAKNNIASLLKSDEIVDMGIDMYKVTLSKITKL